MKNRIQLVVPMAGRGDRFINAGYKTLKPLILIHNVPMISVVLKNLITPAIEHVVLVVQRETFENLDLRKILSFVKQPISIVAVDAITAGPADTVRRARPVLNDKLPLVVANSDQFINASLEDYYTQLIDGKERCSILTMEDSDPKWSYVALNERGEVSEIKEKVVISNLATAGIYGFSEANLAWNAFTKMWENKDLTNNEYYVAPAINYLIHQKIQITSVNLGPINQAMFGLGTPEDYEIFLKSTVSQSITQEIIREQNFQNNR